jgi:hypothetical protein
MPNLPRVMLRAPLRVVAWLLLLLMGFTHARLAHGMRLVAFLGHRGSRPRDVPMNRSRPRRSWGS